MEDHSTGSIAMALKGAITDFLTFAYFIPSHESTRRPAGSVSSVVHTKKWKPNGDTVSCHSARHGVGCPRTEVSCIDSSSSALLSGSCVL